MHLRFGGAGTDGPPADEVADVLRRNGVEEFRTCRHAQAIDLEQQIARHPQAFVDAKALVQIRIVDQALPADGSARLLEIHPHDDFQIGRQPLAQRQQAPGVFHRRIRIMDRAWPDDHQQAVGLAPQDVLHRMPGAIDQALGRRVLHREKPDQMLRRRQRHNVGDALIVGAGGLVDGDGQRNVVEVGCGHDCGSLLRRVGDAEVWFGT